MIVSYKEFLRKKELIKEDFGQSTTKRPNQPSPQNQPNPKFNLQQHQQDRTISYHQQPKSTQNPQIDIYNANEIRDLEQRITSLETNYYIQKREIEGIMSFNQWLAQRIDTLEKQKNSGIIQKMLGRKQQQPITPPRSAYKGTWPEYWSSAQHKIDDNNPKDATINQNDYQDLRQLNTASRIDQLP